MNRQFANKLRIVIQVQKMLLWQLAPLLDMNTAQLSKIERGVKYVNSAWVKYLKIS